MISNVVAEALHKMINILTKIDEFDIELLKQMDFLRFTLNRQSSCSWLEVSHRGGGVGRGGDGPHASLSHVPKVLRLQKYVFKALV